MRYSTLRQCNSATCVSAAPLDSCGSFPLAPSTNKEYGMGHTRDRLQMLVWVVPRLLVCVVRTLRFIWRPFALKHSSGLEVSSFNSSKAAKNKAASRHLRGGKLSAMIDGSVQNGVASIGIWYCEVRIRAG
uniref:Uncharacterized protein n=1 Tax=Tetraselmis chuii TaxID=63592 RepID=A0A7S1SXA5_9CHLO